MVLRFMRILSGGYQGGSSLRWMGMGGDIPFLFGPRLAMSE